MNLQELKDLCRQRGLKAVFNEDSVSKSMASVSIVLSVSSKKSKEKKSHKTEEKEFYKCNLDKNKNCPAGMLFLNESNLINVFMSNFINYFRIGYRNKIFT